MVGAILSEHYNASNPSTPKAIKREEHRSSIVIAQTDTSYGHGKYKGPYISINSSGDKTGTHKTSNNTFTASVSKYGDFSPQVDDVLGYGSWVNAATNVKPIMFDLVPTISQIANTRGLAYITGTPVGLYLPHPSDTNMPKLKVSSKEVMAIDNNYAGLYESRITTNLEHTMRSLMPGGKYHFEGQEWIDFLGKKGFRLETADTAGVRGLGILNDVQGEGFTWGYFPKLGYLVAEGLVHKKIEQMARQYGLDGSELPEAIEAIKRADVMHETGHILDIKGKWIDERMQGLLRAEFYGMMAEKHKGNKKLARIYKALRKEGLDYADGYSLENWIWETITANPFPNKMGILEILKKKFSGEADALELEGLVREMYINERLEDTGIIDLYKGEPSYKDSRAHSKSNSGKRQVKEENLDAVVAKESAASSESDGHAKESSGSRAALKVIKGGKGTGNTKKTNDNYERGKRQVYESRELDRKEASDDKAEAPKDAEAKSDAMAEAA